MMAKRWRRLGSVKRTLISMPSRRAEGVQSGAKARGVAIRRTPRGLEGHAELAAGDLFLQRLDIIACCSNRKAVTRAMTPVLSRPITVRVANCLILEQEMANFRPDCTN
jgi:hypothetical protein